MVAIYSPVSAPNVIKIIGANLNIVGIITILLLIGLTQVSIAPEITAIDDRTSNGVLIGEVSLIMIQVVEFEGERIVIKVKRIE